jgi:hypothetical protein
MTSPLTACPLTAAYVNFLMEEGQERVREAYGAPKHDRLRQLKRQYDRRTSSG